MEAKCNCNPNIQDSENSSTDKAIYLGDFQCALLAVVRLQVLKALRLIVNATG